MSLNFPSSPDVNDTYTFAGTTWRYDGVAWNVLSPQDSYLSAEGTQTVRNKSISGGDNTLASIPQSSVTGLSTDLSGKASATELSGHTSSSTSVHGITNTADLVVTTDARLADTRTPTDGSVTDAKVASGGLSPTAITGTAVVTGDLTGHTSATTSVHGITNTADLATKSYADAAAANAAANVVDSAPATLDTLSELATALGNDPNFATTTATSLGNRVRVDAAQTFSDSEKIQARSNIDAVSTTDSRLSDQRTPLDNSVTSAKIVDGTIVDADVSTTAAIAQSKIANLTTDLGLKADKTDVETAVPSGMLSPYAGSSAPSGWLLCFGQNVSRSTFSALFAAIGTTYGSGDGSTTFRIPDLRGRVIAALDNMGGSDAGRLTWNNALGTTGGSETHTLTTSEMPSHTHTQNQHTHTFTGNSNTTGTQSANHTHSGTTTSAGNHSHTGQSGGNIVQGLGSAGSANVSVGGGGYTVGFTAAAGAHTHTMTTGNNSANHTHTVTPTGSNANTTAVNQNTGGGSAHNNMQPTILLNYIIKT